MIPAISTLAAGIGWLAKNWLGVLSTAIGVSGFLHSIVNSRSIKRQTLEQRRALSAVELRQWADEVANALSAAVHLDAAASNTSEERKQVLTRLSALIERGRFWFPNNPSRHGQEKAAAHSGYRRRILDWVVLAYKVCELNPPGKEADPVRNLLWLTQIQFTGDSQSAVSVLSSAGKFKADEDFMDTSKTHPHILELEKYIEDQKTANAGRSERE